MNQFGCLYYSKKQRRFITPDPSAVNQDGDIVPHYGRPGGILPQYYDGDLLADQLKALSLSH